MEYEIDYLPVATGTSANVDTQAEFVASTYQATGFTAGTASSSSANKIWRQASMMAAAVANLISNALGINVLDDGNLPELVTNLTNAIPAAASAGTLTQVTAAPGTSNTEVANTAFVSSAVAAGTAYAVVTNKSTAQTLSGPLAATALTSTGAITGGNIAASGTVSGTNIATMTSNIATLMTAASVSWPSRALGSTYQNSNAVRLKVYCAVSLAAGASSAYAAIGPASNQQLDVDQVSFGSGEATSVVLTLAFDVPPGWYYSIYGSAAAAISWYEVVNG